MDLPVRTIRVHINKIIKFTQTVLHCFFCQGECLFGFYDN